MTVKQLIQKRKIPFEIVAPSNEELDEGSKELNYTEQ